MKNSSENVTPSNEIRKLPNLQILYYRKRVSFSMGQLGDIFGQSHLLLCKRKTTQHVSCILISSQH